MKKLIIVLLSLCLLLAGCGSTAPVNELSAGIGYLRGQKKIEKCTQRREPLMLCAEDFDSGLGCEVSYIVIETLPDPATGNLSLKGEAVCAGQTVAASSLNFLRFTPTGAAGDIAVFGFRCRDGGWENTQLACEITLKQEANSAPFLADGKLNAIAGVPSYGVFNCDDADGDGVLVTVTSFPLHGSVELLSGRKFVYTPHPGFEGSDSFTCSVSDPFGAVGGSLKITAEVRGNSGGIVFSDMTGRDGHYNAARLCLDGIMDYSLENGEYAFAPDKTVPRIDFLVMLMSSCSNAEVFPVSDTVFADDDKLSTGRKSYLAKAAEVGIIEVGNGLFKPFEPITKAEACVWLAKTLKLPVSDAGFAFADSGEVPEWALPAVVSALSAGIVSAERGYFSPNSQLTRIKAAAMLCDALDYIEVTYGKAS